MITVESVDCVDYHTAGEPFRIVPSGTVPIPGDTVAERRAIAVQADGTPRDTAMETVRRLLCHEPRGHADMYGGFVVPPDDDGAHLGVLFWHKDGYSTACGHGTIALGAWVVDSGLVAAPEDGETTVRIDVPSGRVAARVRRRGGRTESVTFRNVPARASGLGVEVKTADFGVVTLDLAHAGACYAVLPAERLGLAPTPEALPDLIRAGRQIRAALAGHPATREPRDPRLSGVYGVLLHQQEPAPDGFALALRSVTVFADGQVDRSPCGSGTSALLAVLTERGRLPVGERLHHRSVIDSVFTARVAETVGAGFVTEITGTAHRTGSHRFELDPRDALGTGFVLR
ncbi:proline racemase family protein [Streptacidiphilus jiangxiensis]|uniref:Trans-L-3-hydroxyproline dehydratase n=1 Tax=Streptacidiphilus jiangxiensis TaxID=235985 RepID=A0A1H7YK97_STRJI|nr:trans-L-3-hydroxyproline dehydratase [Streptacidiphilus jiangxiensis]